MGLRAQFGLLGQPGAETAGEDNNLADLHRQVLHASVRYKALQNSPVPGIIVPAVPA